MPRTAQEVHEPPEIKGQESQVKAITVLCKTTLNTHKRSVVCNTQQDFDDKHHPDQWFPTFSHMSTPP